MNRRPGGKSRSWLRVARLTPVVVCLVSLFTGPVWAETITLTVQADQGPTTYPVWVDKDAVLAFQVAGTWTMWDKWPPVDARGHTSANIRVGGKALGALLARIEGGAAFAVQSGVQHRSPSAGRLVLYPNRGNYVGLNASGGLQVTVTGGRSVTDAEAEKLAGWDLSEVDTARNVDYLSEAEKDVILLLNKARVDPKRFALQYLANAALDGGYAKECCREMLALLPRGALKPSKALSMAAKGHAVDMGRSGKVGHVGSDGSDVSTRVKRFGNWNASISENCSYGFDDPLEIVLQLLIDDGVTSRGHRRNILDPVSAFVGTSIQPHTKYRFDCVQDFAASISEKN